MSKTLSEISHNVKIKRYPDGGYKALVASSPIFVEKGFETVENYLDTPERNDTEPVAKRNKDADIDNVLRALRRAREKCKDLAFCNDFTHFVTLTFNKEYVDRYSYDDIYKRLRVWLSNRVSRQGLFYVLIPEHHKDGAIHYHGFFGGKVDYIYAKTDKNGIDIYNIADFPFGFTTAIPLHDDYRKAVNYTMKYMTKDTVKIGGRWYYSGGKLKRPTIEYTDHYDTPFGSPSYEFDVPECNTHFQVYESIVNKITGEIF